MIIDHGFCHETTSITVHEGCTTIHGVISQNKRDIWLELGHNTYVPNFRVRCERIESLTTLRRAKKGVWIAKNYQHLIKTKQTS